MGRVALFLLALVMIAVGVVIGPILDVGKPDFECAPDGTASSGFEVEVNGEDCATTIESQEEYNDWNEGMKWDNIAALVLWVLAAVLIIIALVRRPRSRRRDDRV